MKMLMVTHQEHYFPSLSSKGSGTCRYTPSWLLATLTTYSPSVHMRILCQGGSIRLQHRILLNIQHEPSPGTFHRGWWLGQSSEDCWLTCARDKLMQPERQVSLGGAVSWALSRKGRCEVQTSRYCLEAELKICKIQAVLPTNLDMALSRMSWNLVTHMLLNLQLLLHQNIIDR